MEKKEAKKINKVGVTKILKAYNLLCRKCKIKSISAVKNNTQDKIFEKYCDKCKKRTKRILGVKDE
ncbi:MAG: hypothetical protein R6U15_00970 [Candidatus Izemoplasmatales bacterium]